MAAAQKKAFTWMAVEAYPLFLAVGAGCGAAVFQMTRWLYASPNAQLFKDSTRKQAIPEDPKKLQEGVSFYNHAVRRFSMSFAGDQAAGIFPKLNKAMSKPNA
mmetsp:Transcript_10245/g.29281  ORF Transcript_10245/g.29281 Transcript_10245/m.29281 type:complete len:103 (+) Transcript_10245:145-453(+)|eukprot:CAMPEP_0117657666 /NCGR_PEP_ID=MMETSP0804-20121206/5452_1 /TAXON_ID=1074897 /ORGANISM="Tetraselmis astigmatica, Strain CCMP880" /LENGTH=102 /DNA_ID=CAMNT_0005464135 /DNA_START=126 /DNA_END=434 /DNA_ORIENTATION=+